MPDDQRYLLSRRKRSSLIEGPRTLIRGLDLLETVSQGISTIPEIALRTGLTKSTAYRLLTALVKREFLCYAPSTGYRLGSRILILGALTQNLSDIVAISRPYLNRLSAFVDDTIILTLPENGRFVCMDIISGRRAINAVVKVGDYFNLSIVDFYKPLSLRNKAEPKLRLQTREPGICYSIKPTLSLLEEVSTSTSSIFFLNKTPNEDNLYVITAPIRNASSNVSALIVIPISSYHVHEADFDGLINHLNATALDISYELGFFTQVP